MAKIGHKKFDLKLEGKQVLWFNGEKWLIKETCKNKVKAKDKFKELCQRR